METCIHPGFYVLQAVGDGVGQVLVVRDSCIIVHIFIMLNIGKSVV